MSPELDAIHDLLSMLNLSPSKFTHFLSCSSPIIPEICFNCCLHTKFIRLAFPVLYLLLLPTDLAVLCNTGRSSQSVGATGKKKGGGEWGEGVKMFLTVIGNYDSRK